MANSRRNSTPVLNYALAEKAGEQRMDKERSKERLCVCYTEKKWNELISSCYTKSQIPRKNIE